MLVKQYVETPDLWEELGRAREFLGSSSGYESAENSLFTREEQAQISRQLREIKEQLRKTYGLTAGQFSRVEARLDDAEKASQRMGRKDWVLLFAGTIFTLIVSDLIPPDVAQHILAMAVHGLGHLFGAGTGPTQPTGLP
jgi:hypothetical protein